MTSECCECGRTVSYKTGFSLIGGLGDSSKDRVYCPQCAPNRGKGYTLRDLERMRDESRITRAQRDIRLMDQLGPDVYFAIQSDRRHEPKGDE